MRGDYLGSSKQRRVSGCLDATQAPERGVSRRGIVSFCIGVGVTSLTGALATAGVSLSADEVAKRDKCIRALSGKPATLLRTSSRATRAATETAVGIYVHDQFDCDEIERVLTSMEHLIHSSDVRSGALSMDQPRSGDLRYPSDRVDALVMWVNPTCPHCRDVMRIL